MLYPSIYVLSSGAHTQFVATEVLHAVRLASKNQQVVDTGFDGVGRLQAFSVSRGAVALDLSIYVHSLGDVHQNGFNV